nr:uncharacterized protein LOC115262805 [Aedes albopictus]
MLTSSAQNQFLSNHMTISPVKYHRVFNSKRTFSHKYFLPAIGGNILVCKGMFCATFDVTNKKMRVLATKKGKKSGISLDDGRMTNSSHNRLSDEDKKRVEDHIKSFPLHTSHYGRAKSDKLYLSSDLNVTIVYDLYVQKCTKENYPTVHYNTFRKIFKTFNISFRSPQVDTCGECDKLHVLIKQSADNEKQSFISILKAHQAKGQEVYDRKNQDVLTAKTDKTVCTASFDLQKCLPTPHLLCGQAYYSRQLYTLNLTIFETFRNKNVGRCFLWDESKARRGSQEVGSCLLVYLRSLIERDKCLKTVNLYSDRCSGQNHNIVVCKTISLFIEECARTNREMIVRHNFMVSGHSHMEVDSKSTTGCSRNGAIPVYGTKKPGCEVQATKAR